MMKRPTSLTTEMKKAAASRIVATLVKVGFLGADQADEAADDIAKAADSPYSDGYSIAKELDDLHGWDCNMQIAMELDRWSIEAGDELKRAEEAWAKMTNPQPQFQKGDHIKLASGESGVVDGIYKYGVAKYEVKIDGDPQANSRMRARRIVNFEDAMAA